MSMIKMLKDGGWWLRSKSDPRWNCEGEGFVGGLIMPTEARKAFELKKKELGKAPEDLQWGYMKD